MRVRREGLRLIMRWSVGLKGVLGSFHGTGKFD